MTTVAAREKSVKLGPLADYVGYHLRLAQDASFQAFAIRAGHGGIRPGHFTLLTLVQQNPGITQTAISHASGRDKSSLTPALRYLEEAGYIERRRIDRDRRAYELHLTPAGLEAAAWLSDHARAHDAELDRILGMENKAALLSALRAIAAAFSDRAGR